MDSTLHTSLPSKYLKGGSFLSYLSEQDHSTVNQRCGKSILFSHTTVNYSKY